MGTETLTSYNLEQELQKAKHHLRGLNENIKRIIGRDPQEITLRGDRKRNFNDTKRIDFNNQERIRNREQSPVPAKRRTQETKSVFSRLSGLPSRDEDHQPKIQSRVIRELPTKQEIVLAQGVDEQSRARNRRMFGSLMGTLQKFCQEESRLKEKEDMKAQIEKKLEDQQLKEKETLKKERQELFMDRKRQQLEIRKLEIKMNRLKEFETWEKSKKYLSNFIKTKTKPNIYFRPKVLNEKCEKRLIECRNDIEKEIENKKSEMNDEVFAIENKFKIRTNDNNDSFNQNNKETSSKHDRRNNNTNDDDNTSASENSDEETFETEDRQEIVESQNLDNDSINNKTEVTENNHLNMDINKSDINEQDMVHQESEIEHFND